MVFSSMSNYNLNPTSNCWNHQQVNHQQLGSSSTEVHHPRPPYIPLPPPPPPPPPPSQQQPPTTIHHQGIIRPGSMTDRARMANMQIPETVLKCPRCASMNTKFCYYNNYSLSQPRYFCKNCRRYWTQGGALRNVPVGGGCRRNKRSNSKGGGGGSSSTRTSKSPARSGSTPSNSSGCSPGHQIRPPVSFMAPLNHLSDYSIADIGANYPGLVPHQMSSSVAEHFNLLQGNVSNYTTSNSGMDPWRFINQQQLVQQYHHPTSFFDGNLEVPPRGSTTPNLYAGLESSHVTVTASESNYKHKLLSPTAGNTAASSADHAQMDLLKLERNINICDTAGISSRGQLMSRPNYQHHHSFTGGLFQGENAQIPQLNWIGASENRNINSNSNSSTAPTIAWTDLISGFSSSSSTTLRPS